ISVAFHGLSQIRAPIPPRGIPSADPQAPSPKTGNGLQGVAPMQPRTGISLRSRLDGEGVAEKNFHEMRERLPHESGKGTHDFAGFGEKDDSLPFRGAGVADFQAVTIARVTREVLGSFPVMQDHDAI